MRNKIAVVALGSTALVSPRSRGNSEEYLDRLHETAGQLLDILRAGYRLVLTHAGGLPLRNFLLQGEAARSLVPAMPLDVLAAQTQGQVGYWLTLALDNMLAQAGMNGPVACVTTRVLVDPADREFAHPSRTVGPIFTVGRAMELLRQGHRLVEVAPGQWRHLAPAPEPKGIVEVAAVQSLLEKGHIVIAGGGGGIAVVRSAGRLRGVEALVRKEAAAACLARALQADLFMQITDHAPTEATRLTLAAARSQVESAATQAAGRALAAAVQYLETGRGKAVITSLGTLASSLRGEAGMHVVA